MPPRPKVVRAPDPSDRSDEPRRRRDWPDKPGSPEWFAVSQERTDDCLDGIDRIERHILRGSPLVRGVLDLLKMSLGKDAKNVPFLVVGAILFVVVAWGTGSYALEAFGFKFSTGVPAAAAQP